MAHPNDDVEPLSAVPLIESEPTPRGRWTTLIGGLLAMGLIVGVVVSVIVFIAVQFWLS